MQIELSNPPTRMYENTRQSCPVCGGYNTVSMTKVPPKGLVKYHCFKADCNVAGYYHKGLSRKEIERIIEDDKRYSNHSSSYSVTTLPCYFVRGIANSSVENYLLSKNCMTGYKDKKSFEIMYDPKENRIVFLKHDNFITKQHPTGAVGRALNRKTFPKSYNYPWSDNNPFIAWELNKEIDNNSTCVIVEDPASACAVSAIDNYAGIALLGTSLQGHYISFISKFSKAVVALDKDAYNKNTEIVKRLHMQGINATMWLLDKDLKDEESIEEIERKYIKDGRTV